MTSNNSKAASAASTGTAAAASSAPASSASSLRQQVLLERLRSKSGQFRSFPDLSKAVRAAVLDRRFSLDSEEKAILQRCLDALQEKIPVRSAHGMAERLETIGRKIGLKFMAAPVHGCFYLSTEMFYVEINIDIKSAAAGGGTSTSSTSGTSVNEAKIHHIDATQSNHQRTVNCPEMIDCLSAGDFPAFVRHLDNLMEAYNLGAQASAPDKSRAWNALSCAEADLDSVFAGYRASFTSAESLLHSSPLGMVTPRRGGLPMQIRYFLPPHELVDAATSSVLECTAELVESRDLGHAATVTLERSEPNCLMPVRSLLTVGKSGQVVKVEDMNANSGNAVSLPARFVLKLGSPLAVTLDNCRKIREACKARGAAANPGFEFDESAAEPLMALIAKNKSGGQFDSAAGGGSGSSSRGLFVTLPDQLHCYFLSDLPSGRAVMVSSVPFSHPAAVSEIVSVLREQAAFNSVVESCVRTNSIQDVEKSVMLEVTYTDLKHLTVSFEHPVDEVLVTVEVDLTDLEAVACKTFSADPQSTTELCPDKIITAIMRRSLSIPVTMRTVIKAGLVRLAKRQREEQQLLQQQQQQQQLQIQQQQLRLSQSMPANGNASAPSQEQNGNVAADANMEDKGGGGDGGGGAASSVEVKAEPMDYDNSSSSAGAAASNDNSSATAGSNSNANNSQQQPPSSDSLNAQGPQDVSPSNPEASSSNPISSSSSAGHSSSSSKHHHHHQSSKMSSSSGKRRPDGSSSSSSGKSSRHKSPSSSSLMDEVSIKAEPGSVPNAAFTKLEGVKPEFMLTKATAPGSGASSSSSTTGKDVKKETSSSSAATSSTSSSSSVPPTIVTDIKPSVSITPIAGGGTGDNGSSKKSSSGGGIEIIPLGGGGGGGTGSTSSSSKNRDMRRSLSEDDKRRLEKKGSGSSSSSSSKKRKHDSPTHSSSSSKKRPGSSPDGKSSSSSSRKSTSSSSSSMSKNLKLASVIDRLSHSTAETGIEILPASSPNTSSSSRPKDKSSKGSSSSSSSSLKLTIKGPSSAGGGSGGGGGKDKPSSSSSSSSKHSSSSKSSSSSGHRHSSSSSSSSSQNKSKSSSSSSSSSDKDRKRPDKERDSSSRHHGGSSSSSSSSSRHHHSSSSSSFSKERDREQEQEEVKKLLGGGKLNKTFQIPKLSSGPSSASSSAVASAPASSSSSKGFSPSHPQQHQSKTPTTSPKYSVSPKQQSQQQQGGSGGGHHSPRYIGGGTVTPPNISPKHSYSAPSSVAGVTRSSPLHPGGSPKHPASRTPGASPTYAKHGTTTVAPQGQAASSASSSKGGGVGSTTAEEQQQQPNA